MDGLMAMSRVLTGGVRRAIGWVEGGEGLTGRGYGTGGWRILGEEVDGIQSTCEEGGGDGEVHCRWVCWVAHLAVL